MVNAGPGRDSALVALGANLRSGGRSPAETLRAALKAFENTGLVVQAVSRFYETPAFPRGSGPDYVNAAAVITGRESPDGMLMQLHSIEADFGRERVQRWGQRVLDLDLLAMGDRVRPDDAGQRFWRELPPERQATHAPDGIILPHPRLQDRAFVLIPLADIAPGWTHPLLGLTVTEMLNALPEADKKAVKPL